MSFKHTYARINMVQSLVFHHAEGSAYRCGFIGSPFCVSGLWGRVERQNMVSLPLKLLHTASAAEAGCEDVVCFMYGQSRVDVLKVGRTSKSLRSYHDSNQPKVTFIMVSTLHFCSKLKKS